MEIKEMIAVLEACKEGKEVECKITGAGRKWCSADCGGHYEWSKPCSDPPVFNFGYYDYRVKPEPPKPREWEVRLSCADGRIYSDAAIITCGNCKVIRVREVLDENREQPHRS